MKPEYAASAITNVLNGINNCPIPVVVECENGEEFPVIKAYRVSGRASAIKILTGGEGRTNNLLDKIEELEESVEIYKKEELNYESELEKAQKELSNLEDAQAREFERIQGALETAQERLGFGTAQRKIEDQIDDLFEKAANIIEALTAEIDRLTVDNIALAWNIEQLENWKQNTLKAE